MKQPVSVFTNLFYAIAGLVALLAAPNAWSVCFAALMLLLTLGSGAYHWTLSRTGRMLDRAGMYLVGGYLFALAAASHAPYLLYVGAVATIEMVIFVELLPSTRIMPPLIAITIGALLPGSVYPLIVFALAGGVRFLGELWHDRGRHQPADVAHGVWHLLSAVALLRLFQLI